MSKRATKTCSNVISKTPKGCGYVAPLVNRATWNSETREVHDDLGNLIGTGEPIWVNGEVVGYEVTPIQP